MIHDNKIAFRLDFDVNLSGSLLFDRDGNLIEDQAREPVTQGPDQEIDLELDLNLDDDTAETGLDEFEDIEPAQDMTEDPMTGQDDDSKDLSVDLPEYDLPEYDLEDDSDDEPEFESALDDELDELIDDTEPGKNEPDEDTQPSQELDDDIDDILKESREFWEKKG